MPDQSPVPANPSATVLLLRDGENGLEVFMVERHRKIDFASGALVFPGGKLDPADAALARARPADGLTPEETAFRLCGIRETFEEAGILLARDEAGGPLVGGARLDHLQDRYRDKLHANEISLGDIQAAEGIHYACDHMTPFAHWITPKVAPKRFDTMFYLAAAPDEQLGDHDGRESVDSVWITPAQALADQAAGKRSIVFATRLNLEKLGRASAVDEAFANAAGEALVTVEPTMEDADGGRIFRIPAEAGYGGSEFFEPAS